MINKCFFILFICSSLFSGTCEEGFEIATTYFKIDRKILREIAVTESNLNPYAVLLKTSNKEPIIELLIQNKIGYKASEPYISIMPKDVESALVVYRSILKNKSLSILDYDLGIMQVNKNNFVRYGVEEEKYYINCRENIFLGSDVLRKCFDKFKTSKETIECYNRGPSDDRIKKSGFVYFNKFIDNYTASR